MTIHTVGTYPQVEKVLLDGIKLEGVVWVDDKTGEYEQYTGEVDFAQANLITKTFQVDPHRLSIILKE